MYFSHNIAVTSSFDLHLSCIEPDRSSFPCACRLIGPEIDPAEMSEHACINTGKEMQ